MAKDDEVTLETLAADYMNLTGTTLDQATNVLAEIGVCLNLTAEKLPRFVALLARAPGVAPIHALVCLATIARLERTQNGNELLFLLGMRAARRFGITSEVLENLRTCVKAPEQSH